MRVRQGSVRDWPFMYSLGKINIPDSASPWRKQPLEETLKYREAVLKGFWTWIQQTGSIVFIAEATSEDYEDYMERSSSTEADRNRSIGYLVLHPSSREELTGVYQGWIMDFGVLPEWRGQGIGKKLLKAAEDYCRQHDISYLGLACSTHNVPALHLYEKSGFVEERKIMVKCLS
ncbi:acetyltransferase [Desulfosporosinus acidiphilus SJ4]|uniref:Acetyltransferase n=1 Tax=Desulfosporosinus acidiphilus (strain DSM 22704 / JCM 16185 / SJ4) TaxID=646529 RepID=I4DA41_DESAJ|nr:GNAT family N-acetyltransferase [Desulfosporosinus acidiphilus]AFM42665.1 acetyltransferase [Desulfosporosinus acidiphilus SJ4]